MQKECGGSERLVEQRKTVKYGRARFIGLTGMSEMRGHPSPGNGVLQHCTSGGEGMCVLYDEG